MRVRHSIGLVLGVATTIQMRQRKSLLQGVKDWMLTADTGSGEAKLQAEYILDGQTIKVGTGQAKIAGEAIAADLVSIITTQFYSLFN